MGVEIRNLTRRKLSLPQLEDTYATVAATVLPKWDISLVFVGPKKAQELNKQLRNKSYIPNVLSYSPGGKSGEIFICIQEAERQASEHSMQDVEFILYLFIHGLLHLKGWAHGSMMEQCERKLTARFYAPPTHGATHSNRHRHRDIPSESGNRRRSR